MSAFFQTRTGAAIMLGLMLLVVVRLGWWLLNGRRERDYSGSLLHDHVVAGMNRVDTGPAWMKGRFGTLVYAAFGGIFILVGIAAAAHVLIYGPHKTATANSAQPADQKGGF